MACMACLASVMLERSVVVLLSNRRCGWMMNVRDRRSCGDYQINKDDKPRVMA
jgi:hypothetical protein